MEIAYWQPHPDLPERRLWDNEQDHLPLAERVRRFDRDRPQFDQRRDDRVAMFIADISDMSILDKSTISFQDASAFDTEEMAQNFRDKAVIVGDISHSPEWPVHFSGHSISPVQAHATWIEYILDELTGTRIPLGFSAILLSAGFATAGLGIGIAFGRRPILRAAILSALIAVAALGSYVLANISHLIITPEVPLLSLVLAAEIISTLKNVCTNRF